LASEFIPDFHLPTEIYIRLDVINNIDSIIPKYGKRAVFITTSYDFLIYHQTIETISKILKKTNTGLIIYDDLPRYPSTEDIDVATSFTKKTNCDLIIGFGGVESISAAKAVSILANNYLFCNDLFNNPELPEKPVRFITIPACPIFGFEIAPIFFLDEIKNMTKQVYFNEALFPHATIIDPGISMSTDIDLIAKSSIASLAMSTESVISQNNNDIVNTYALKAIDMIFRNLSLSYKDQDNPAPRVYLSTASLMSGIAFSTAYSALALAISLAIASKTKITVDSAMSIIIPHIMEFNLTASPGKYVQMSKVMGEDVREITVIEAAIKAIEAIRKLESDINIPQRLSNYDLPKTAFKEIAELAMIYPFTKNTPRQINSNEIETILIAAY
jgi:alcohol dehydrogenase class IV